MRNKTYVLAISMGAIISLAVFAGASVVFATTNSYNCTLSSGTHCGKSYTAYSFDSDVTSNSASQPICAGYVLSGTVYCTPNITIGYGSSFSNSYSQSFSSYYRNDGSGSTTIGVSDIYCNCFSSP